MLRKATCLAIPSVCDSCDDFMKMFCLACSSCQNITSELAQAAHEELKHHNESMTTRSLSSGQTANVTCSKLSTHSHHHAIDSAGLCSPSAGAGVLLVPEPNWILTPLHTPPITQGPAMLQHPSDDGKPMPFPSRVDSMLLSEDQSALT